MSYLKYVFGFLSWAFFWIAYVFSFFMTAFELAMYVFLGKPIEPSFPMLLILCIAGLSYYEHPITPPKNEDTK